METKCNKINFCVFFSSKYYFCSPRFFFPALESVSLVRSAFFWRFKKNRDLLWTISTKLFPHNRTKMVNQSSEPTWLVWIIGETRTLDTSTFSEMRVNHPARHKVHFSLLFHDEQLSFDTNDHLDEIRIVFFSSNFFAWMKKWNWVERKNFMTQQQ